MFTDLTPSPQSVHYQINNNIKASSALLGRKWMKARDYARKINQENPGVLRQTWWSIKEDSADITKGMIKLKLADVDLSKTDDAKATIEKLTRAIQDNSYINDLNESAMTFDVKIDVRFVQNINLSHSLYLTIDCTKSYDESSEFLKHGVKHSPKARVPIKNLTAPR